MSRPSRKPINNDQEMVSLIPREERRPPPPPVRRIKSDRSDQSSVSSSWSGKMKRRAKKKQQQNDEERVSLIGSDGKPTPAPNQRRKSKKSKSLAEADSWTLTRLMKYLSLTCCSAVVTFAVLEHQSRVLRWEEYQHVLEPVLAKSEQRCFIQNKAESDERCPCPDPTKPLPNDDILWKKHHDAMYYDAKHAPENLDIVLLGDSIVERWNGTRHFGTHPMEGMRDVFERKFTKKGGGTLQGLALGSSGDTGPNVLWHLKNGVLGPLKPKVWLILVGTNDLFELRCTDRFVVANIMNVLKMIYDQQPDAQFILHGILPRTDEPFSESQFLGKVWKRAQAVNWQLRKFCEHKPNIHYMQAGPLFMEETDVRGRRQIDKAKMSDGLHPTKEGLEVWGDYIVKQVTTILQDAEEAAAREEKEQRAN